MNFDLARDLLPLVNDKAQMDRVIGYANDRIGQLRAALETARSWDEVRELQGQIKALRRFATLRDEVLAEGKRK